MKIKDQALQRHRQWKGKLEIVAKAKIKKEHRLHIHRVAEPGKIIEKRKCL